jgi:hypothetical protein
MQNGSQVGTDMLYAGNILYYQQLAIANWGETVNWAIVPYTTAGPCNAPLTYSFTVMAEPDAGDTTVPAAVVYADLQNVTVTDPALITVPGIELNGESVQPTFDFHFGSAPSLATLRCIVMDQPQHDLPHPECCGAALTVTLPSGISTTIIFTSGGTFMPYQLLHWTGSSWEDISDLATFGAGSVTLAYTASLRASDEEFVINDGSGTLPVTLSSFNAVQTSEDYAQLAWTTQTETEMSGYYVFRSNSEDLASAERVSDLITAENNATTNTYRYVDTDVQMGQEYHYWLLSLGLNGDSQTFGPVSITITDSDPGSEVPEQIALGLHGAYPNPFNPSTTISYTLGETSAVQLDVFNFRGQHVRTLQTGNQTAGDHNVVWDGHDGQGQSVPSGMYLFRLRSNGTEYTSKAMLMK